MNTVMSHPVLLWALGAFVLAWAVVLVLIMVPGAARLPLARRRPPVEKGPGALTRATSRTTGAIDDVLRKHDNGRLQLLDLAGIAMPAKEFVLLVIVGVVVASGLGLLLGGPLVALLFGGAAALGVRIWLGMKVSRRQRAFGENLDDALQQLAGSLRAGHSLGQALASVAQEAEQPVAAEFTRVINQARLDRPIEVAMAETARRMKSDDLAWVTQAIAINREVGGNLAEVLDGVGHTIRERAQIKRQVAALSAEGKLSAIVLMLLPVLIVGALLMLNPAYIAKFTESIIGYGLIGISALLLVAGGLWLRKTVTIKF